jgi:16S rRNA G966 N2-methylase RsmD
MTIEDLMQSKLIKAAKEKAEHNYQQTSNKVANMSFTEEDVTVLPLKSGYDILKSENFYDLIFLDPYDDIWNVYEEVIEKIRKKTNDSSVLLFVPFTEQNPYRELIETIKGRGIKYVNGIAETRNPEMDGKWNAAMFLFPANAIRDEKLTVVENKLILF